MQIEPPRGKHYEAFKRLYPTLNDEQLARAEDNVRRYLALLVRIEMRRQNESEAGRPPHDFDKSRTVR